MNKPSNVMNNMSAIHLFLTLGSTAVSSGHTATRGVSSSLASVSANSKSGE